ncbi:MAG: NTP transferase domain-containing protein [Candidatus Binatia bacterium]
MNQRLKNVRSTHFTALVLAGRRGPIDPVAQSASCSHKVLVPVAGTPMILHVVRNLRAAQTIDAIVICTDNPAAFAGLTELHTLANSGGLGFYQTGGRSPSESVLQYFASNLHPTPLLITTADHPLLTTEMIDYFCTEASASAADVAVGMVAESSFRKHYPNSQRSFIPLRNDSYCGTNLFALLTPQGVAAARFWNHAGQFRKRPWRLISTFGLTNLLLIAFRRLDLAGVLPRASRAIGARTAVVQMPFPECAIDVDTLYDLATVTRILAGREKNDEE